MSFSSPAQPSVTSWSSVGDHHHAVQFYSEEATLIRLLAGYVGSALVNGDAAVVIATDAHRHDLTACLKSRGFDVEIAASQGRYIALDAAETLAKFRTRDSLNVDRFNRLMSTVIAQARTATGNARGRVATFGEMVSLLWMTGQSEMALQLETFWNTLLHDELFSLCCAYPMKMFDGKDAGAFLRVCAQHSHVFPAEPRRLGPPRRMYTWPLERRDVAAEH